MARKKDEGGPGGVARLSPVDVQQIQFRRALRGYDEQEVDDFLDRVTEELTLLIDERRSATERAGSLPTVRVSSAGDAASANRQAEEILRQARERGDAIVREAQQRASAIIREAEARAAAGGVAVAGPGGQAAIAGFVAKEREFLQQLASLVQGHAEGVKGMVASARDAGSASPGTTVPGTIPSPATGSGPAAGGGGAAGGGSAFPTSSSGSTGPAAPGQASSSERGGSASPASATSPSAQRGPGPAAAAGPEASGGRAALATEARPSERPVVVPESPPSAGAPAPVQRQASPTPDDPEDSSLRALFWGED